jgi:hypothetical protein
MFDIKPKEKEAYLNNMVRVFYVYINLPGPSSTDKGLPDLKTGSPTVKPP